jgi:hypothetical protein
MLFSVAHPPTTLCLEHTLSGSFLLTMDLNHFRDRINNKNTRRPCFCTHIALASERLLRSALCFTNSKLLLHPYHFYRDIIFHWHCPGFLREDRWEFPRLPRKVYSRSAFTSIKARRLSPCPDQDLSDLVLQRTVKLEAKTRTP